MGDECVQCGVCSCMCNSRSTDDGDDTNSSECLQHCCTNNSHPDIVAKLQQCSGSPSSHSCRRHSTGASGPEDENGGGVGGALARHVWCRGRIVRSLSQEGFFPSPNEHHPALVRPLAAIGDLALNHPDLPARLHYLATLLAGQNSPPALVNPADCHLLSSVAQLSIPPEVTPRPTSNSTPTHSQRPLSRPSSLDCSSVTSSFRKQVKGNEEVILHSPCSPCSSSTSTSSVSTPSDVFTPTSVSSSSTGVLVASRTSSVASCVSSLPEDNHSDSEDQDTMEGEVATPVPQQQYYNHHAYHIYNSE